MKATGIVRRIDDLGRVVIPKEIRRTLRIKEGDPLEIYTDRDGQVIFKKYSPIGELGTFAAELADAMNKSTGSMALVTDRDAVIAATGGGRRELGEKTLSEDLERLMEGRQIYRYHTGDAKVPVADGMDKYFAGVAAPIISQGDIIGCVVFALSETNPEITDTEYALAQTAATFLSHQMES